MGGEFMAKMKRHMSHEEEFDIMKMVLDKFLWLGVGIMALGFYKMVTLTENLLYGFSVLLAGAVILIIFIIILVKEYNFIGRS
jgi:hypothetical protein